MNRYQRLCDLRGIFMAVERADYHGKAVKRLKNKFVKESREFFEDESLDFEKATSLIFSLPVQDEMIALDELEEDQFELPEMSKE